MSEQPMELSPDAPRQPNPFGDGYREGQSDLLFAIAHGHQWALDKLEMAWPIRTPLVEIIERILDEKSAWIARPSREVTEAIALGIGGAIHRLHCDLSRADP